MFTVATYLIGFLLIGFSLLATASRFFLTRSPHQWFFGGAILIVTLCWGCGQSGQGGTSEQTTAALLVPVGESIHDFGDCYQGDVLVHKFPLVNQGQLPVKIVGIQTSCGCLVPDPEGRPITTPIAPGETFELPVEFTPRSQHGLAETRATVAYHSLSTNQDRSIGEDEPAEPLQSGFLSLTVRANIVPDYRITPQRVDFGEIDGLGPQKVTRSVRIVPVALSELKIVEATSSNEQMQVDVREESGDSGFEIEISLNTAVFGTKTQFHGWVILSTNSERLPTVRIPVTAGYGPPAVAEPKIIIITSDETGDVVRDVLIKTRWPSRINDVHSPDKDHVRVEFDGSAQAREHQLKLFVAESDGRPIDCKVQVNLELFRDDQQRTSRSVEIPVHRFPER